MQIQSLHLQSTHLAAQQQFYTDVLGLELEASSADSFQLKIGDSRLIFTQAESSIVYHFAFNIPSGQIAQAATWLKGQGLTLLEKEDNEIHNFSHWNAYAIYFLDADQNIVELIDRRNLKLPGKPIFDNKSILYLCEMGMPVSDVGAICQGLQKDLGLARYSGNLEQFAALGDEQGLFIVVDQNAKLWFPTEDPAEPAPFEIAFQEQGKDFYLKYESGGINLELETKY